jgi:4-diphosphocytidyl-2-C-methyl-D-erythritol kinase
MSLVKGKRVGATALLELFNSVSIGSDYTLAAPAKVNLRLKVLGRRPDGYHLLSMLNVLISLADEVRVRLTPKPGFDLRAEPNTAIPGTVLDNSVAQAWSGFWSEFSEAGAPCGASVVVIKRIPIGAGLGGGSSDAAAMLRFLAETFGATVCRLLGLTESEFDTRIMKVALAVGADVPYAYRAGICWVTGIGEQITQLATLAPWAGDVLITMPRVSVPTVEFYRFFREKYPALTETTDLVMERIACGDATCSLVDLIGNDFESAVAAFRPEIDHALSLVRQHYPETTSLTGSGSAIFSLVTPEQAPSLPVFRSSMEAAGFRVFVARMV